MESFREYCLHKKIDPMAFENADKEKFTLMTKEFSEMSTESFTARKLYLINGLRRKYPIIEQTQFPENSIKKQ